MMPTSNTSSGNGSIKSRSRPSTAAPPSSNGNLQKQSIKLEKSNNNFAKITTLVFIIAVADVLFVWYSIHTSFEGNGSEPHGAEVGLHHLHEKKRMEKITDHLHDEFHKTKQLSYNALPPHKKKSSTHNMISGTTNNTATNIQQQNKPQIDERIAAILQAANIEVDDETVLQLPSWDDAVSLYGEKPIIYGLDTCEKYRQTVKPEDRMLGPSGIFNTGTNLLFQLMKDNCDIKEAKHSTTHKEQKQNGMRWQAPWGKHNPVSTHRLTHVAKMWGTVSATDTTPINHTAFFPVTMIKDPYTWMGSQCRHHYTCQWNHGPDNCPNLVKKNVLDKLEPEKVGVKFAKVYIHYNSLLDLWNKYYQDWEVQTFPHLTTRFEDLLFHGEEVTRTVCDCVGGVFREKFRYIEGSAKENGMPIHKGANGLVKALIQYGNPEKRLTGMTDRDLEYATTALNRDLMEKYDYSYPPL